MFDESLHVIGELVVELAIDCLSEEQRPNAKSQHRHPALEPHGLCLSQLHDLRDRSREPVPVGGFTVQLPAAGSRERIELGAAIVLARPPLGFDPSRAAPACGARDTASRR